MLWVPKKGLLRHQHNRGSVGSTTWGTSVTTGSTSSTKGTPAEIFSSTSFDAFWILIVAHSYQATVSDCRGALDILIGSATEEVLIPNLLFGYAANVSNLQGPKMWQFPLYIPAGSRIAAQAAGGRTSTAFRVGIDLYGGDGSPPFRVGSKVTTYGMGTVPSGTAITPGASGAEGSWTEIVVATSEDHFAFYPSFQPNGDTSISNAGYAIDIGVGSATEEMIGESFMYGANTSEAMAGPWGQLPVFADVPSGSRLVMRASNSVANDAGYDAVIHAVS
jgi:hypothetical protein